LEQENRTLNQSIRDLKSGKPPSEPKEFKIQSNKVNKPKFDAEKGWDEFEPANDSLLEAAEPKMSMSQSIIPPKKQLITYNNK
jgi:hypothetical protein